MGGVSYDNKIVRGPNDIVEPYFQGNNAVQATFSPGTGVSVLFNLFNANSFYLNGLSISASANIAATSGDSGVSLVVGPNPNSLVGVTGFSEWLATVPTSTSSTNGLLTLANVSNIGYRNRTGANQYLHATLASGQPLISGFIIINLFGGPTSLVS